MNCEFCDRLAAFVCEYCHDPVCARHATVSMEAKLIVCDECKTTVVTA